MAHPEGSEENTAQSGSSPRPFPIRRALLTVAVGAIAGAAAIFSIWQQNPRAGDAFTGIGITVYAAVVMGIVGLLCAAIFRATWPFRWSEGARGVLMMIVGAALGVAAGLCIGTGASGELQSAFAQATVVVYTTILNTIVWTIGGATSSFPRSPRAATTHKPGFLATTRLLTTWQKRALVATFIAVGALGVVSWVGERLTPRPPPPGPTLARWGGGPPLSLRQELMFHILSMVVIGVALAATVLGSNEVVRRFRRGEAGLGTAIMVLALLPLAVIGVGGFVIPIIVLFRTSL
jgi:hypothetical protein